jgi:hypothetical protein
LGVSDAAPALALALALAPLAVAAGGLELAPPADAAGELALSDAPFPFEPHAAVKAVKATISV